MGNQHWIKTTLSAITNHPQYGWTSKATSKGKYKYFRTTDIKTPVKWDSVPFCAVLPPDSDKYTLKKDDLLVSRAGSVGMSIRITENYPSVIFASYLIRIRPLACVIPKLLEYFFQSHEYWSYISKTQTGIAVPNVNATKLSELPFLLPPIDEQQQIVDKLDAILPKIRKVKERLEKIPILLKKFRQSILSAACTGKLTEDWRAYKTVNESGFELMTRTLDYRKRVYALQVVAAKKNKQPIQRKPTNLSDKLFLENIEMFQDIPDNWAFIPLARIAANEANSIVDGPFGSSINVKTDYLITGVPVVRISNIRPFQMVDFNYKFVSQDKFITLRRHNILKNDVLLVKVGATIGDCCVYNIDAEAMLSTTGSCRIRVDLEITTPAYACIVLNNLKNYLQQTSSVMAQPFLNMDRIKNIPFPLAPLDEQKEIESRVGRLLTLSDSLEAKYKKAMQRIEKIEQSILAKAFRGELVGYDSI